MIFFVGCDVVSSVADVAMCDDVVVIVAVAVNSGVVGVGVDIDGVGVVVAVCCNICYVSVHVVL